MATRNPITWRNVNAGSFGQSNEQRQDAISNITGGLSSIGSAIEGFDASQTDRIDTNADLALDQQLSDLKAKQQSAIAQAKNDIGSFEQMSGVKRFNNNTNQPEYFSEEELTKKLKSQYPTLSNQEIGEMARDDLVNAKTSFANIMAKDYSLANDEDLDKQIRDIQAAANTNRVNKTKSSAMDAQRKQVIAEANAQEAANVDNAVFDAQNAMIDATFKNESERLRAGLEVENQNFGSTPEGSFYNRNAEMLKNGTMPIDTFESFAKTFSNDKDNPKQFFTDNLDKFNGYAAAAEDAYDMYKQMVKGDLPDTMPPAFFERMLKDQSVTDDILDDDLNFKNASTPVIKNKSRGNPSTRSANKSAAKNKLQSAYGIDPNISQKYLDKMSKASKAQQQIYAYLINNGGIIGKSLEAKSSLDSRQVDISRAINALEQDKLRKQIEVGRNRAEARNILSTSFQQNY